MKFLLAIVISYAALLSNAEGASKASTLRKSLLSDYDRYVNPDDQVTVNVSMSVLDLHYCNMRQVLTLRGWVFQSWVDSRLAYSADQFGGLDSLRIPADQIWLPDISVYNSVEGSKSLTMDFDATPRALVYPTGLVYFVPPVLIKAFCPDNVGKDDSWKWAERSCNITMGSWTYNKAKIDVLPMKNSWRNPVDLDYFKNKRVEITSTDCIREDKAYDCCPNETYPSLKFNLNFKSTARLEDGKITNAP